jgi:osmotically-inducible protein OsmY
MTDDELQDWVREELCWDPKVDSAAIAVSANAGEVTLRGTVASFRQKREAPKAATCWSVSPWAPGWPGSWP